MRLTVVSLLALAALGACSDDVDNGGLETVPLPGLSDDYAQDMAERAEMFGIVDPPPVTPIRVVTREELYRVQHECLADQGFTTEILPDGGGLSVDLADGQAEAYYIADYICAGRYPLHEVYTSEYTDAQLRTYYDWNTGELATCMGALGYDVPQAPSFAVFIQAYEAGRGLWMPFDEVPEELWQETVADIDEHCQVEPADEAVFGDVN